MLTESIAKLRTSAPIRTLCAFFRSPWYLSLVVALMALANLFSLELPVFYLYLLLGTLVILFDADVRALIPIACCSYMTVSYENNPALHPHTAAFYLPAFRIQLTVILCLAGVLMIGRLVTILWRGQKKKPPLLALGFGGLGLSFVLGGLFSGSYGFRTALFGFAVIASLCGLYFYFYYGVDWTSAGKRDFAKLFLAIGLGMLVELLGMYLKSGILHDADGGSDRGVLITGWGMYNNVGCVIAMSLPAALYLARGSRHGWIYTVLSCLLFGGLVMTQSRSSILAGAALYAAGFVLLLIPCGKEERLLHLIVLAAAFFAAVCLAAVLRDKFVKLFGDLLNKTFGGDVSNGRTELYEEGWNHFTSAPFFGVGFYRCTAFQWIDPSIKGSTFLPPRYHNTLLQMLASCGIFGLVCYLLHRVETLFMLFRNPSPEKTYIFLSIAALLLTSLVECHFFSFGPGLLYSVLLVYAEGSDLSRPPKTEAPPAAAP